MNGRKIISVLMICIMLFSCAAVLDSCSLLKKEPKDLQEFVDGSEGADEELQQINDSLSSDQLDGDMKIEGNTIVLTLKLKETYDSKHFEDMQNGADSLMESYNDRFIEVIEHMEKSSGIEGVQMQLVMLNGDGAEIYSKTITKE